MINCYYCEEFKEIQVPVPDALNPFCSELEHEEWAKKHYSSPKRGGQKSIKDIQERLLKMGKQANLPINGKLFEDELKTSLDH